MIYYLIGLLSYYKLAKKTVPWTICLIFIAVVTIPPGITLHLFINKHWAFQLVAFAGGLFYWTFIEYYLHRFLMNKKIKGFTFPEKIVTTAFGRWAILILALSIFSSAVLISNYLFLPAGILTGCALCCFIHKQLHQPTTFRWLGKLSRSHSLFHQSGGKIYFGITTTLWDRLFNSVILAKNDTSKRSNADEFKKFKIPGNIPIQKAS